MRLWSHICLLTLGILVSLVILLDSNDKILPPGITSVHYWRGMIWNKEKELILAQDLSTSHWRLELTDCLGMRRNITETIQALAGANKASIDTDTAQKTMDLMQVTAADPLNLDDYPSRQTSEFYHILQAPWTQACQTVDRDAQAERTGILNNLATDRTLPNDDKIKIVPRVTNLAHQGLSIWQNFLSKIHSLKITKHAGEIPKWMQTIILPNPSQLTGNCNKDITDQHQKLLLDFARITQIYRRDDHPEDALYVEIEVICLHPETIFTRYSPKFIPYIPYDGNAEMIYDERELIVSDQLQGIKRAFIACNPSPYDTIEICQPQATGSEGSFSCITGKFPNDLIVRDCPIRPFSHSHFIRPLHGNEYVLFINENPQEDRISISYITTSKEEKNYVFPPGSYRINLLDSSYQIHLGKKKPVIKHHEEIALTQPKPVQLSKEHQLHGYSDPPLPPELDITTEEEPEWIEHMTDFWPVYSIVIGSGGLMAIVILISRFWCKISAENFVAHLSACQRKPRRKRKATPTVNALRTRSYKRSLNSLF